LTLLEPRIAAILVRYAIFLGVGRSEPRALRLRTLAHELESGCEVAAPSLANPVKSLFS